MSHNSVVELNIGGVVYTTTSSTLTKFPDSMLGAMFSGSMPTTRDHNGRFFIDRNGDLFQYILDYLRSAQLPAKLGDNLLHRLLMEADFYQIQPLIEEIQGLLQRHKRQIHVLEINMVFENAKWALRVFGDEEVLDDIPIPKHYCITSDIVLQDRYKFIEWKNELAFCCSVSTRIEAYLRRDGWNQTYVTRDADKGLCVERWVKCDNASGGEAP